MTQKAPIYITLGKEGSRERQTLGMIVGRAHKRWRHSQAPRPYGTLLTKIQQDPEDDWVVCLKHEEAKLLLSTLISALGGGYTSLPTGLD